jgi:hypothetical protein
MKSRFTLVALLALGLGFTACEDAFNEKDAIEAQKELLTLKYQNEMELEKLRQSATTALEQLKFANAIAQIKLEDSLTRAGEAAAKRQSYSLRVLDYNTSTPIEGATVTVASEGVSHTATTDASGFVVMHDLVLYDGSLFQVVKDGFAATSISKASLSNNSPAYLWNTSKATNVIKGKLFIESDLTNATAETVPAGVLVTARVWVSGADEDYGYSVEFPATTSAAGTYSINVPDSPGNSYYLRINDIAADQKLYISGSEDNGNSAQAFPNALPQVATVKTNFRINPYNSYPQPSTAYYLKFEADSANGVVAYANVGVGSEMLSDGTGNYQISGLNVYNYSTPENARLKYAKNDTIAVTLVDWTGKMVKNAPKLVAYTDANGALSYTYNTSNVNGSYVDFVRKADGSIAEGARGTLYKSLSSGPNKNGSYNFEESVIVSEYYDRYVYVSGGQVIVKNFSFDTGYNRDKVIY